MDMKSELEFAAVLTMLQIMLCLMHQQGALAQCTFNGSSVTPVPKGRMNLVTLASRHTTPDADFDDGSWRVDDLPFPFITSGRDYQQEVYVGANTYLTFGGQSGAYSDLTASNPPLPTLFVGAADNSALWIGMGVETIAGTPTYRIRLEGAASPYGDTVNIEVEWTFFPGTPFNMLQVVVGAHERAGDAQWGLSDGAGTWLGQPDAPYNYSSHVYFSTDRSGYDWYMSAGHASCMTPPPSPSPLQSTSPTVPSPTLLPLAPPAEPIPALCSGGPSAVVLCTILQLLDSGSGGTVLLAQLFPGATRLEWEQPLYVELPAGTSITLDGLLPPTTQPHTDALPWNGKRHRMVLTCETLLDDAVHVSGSGSLSVQGLQLQNFSASAGIRFKGQTLLLNDSLFVSLSDEFNGYPTAAVVSAKSVRVTDTWFRGPDEHDRQGYLDGMAGLDATVTGQLTVERCKFEKTISELSTLTLVLDDGTALIANTTFEGCTSDSAGALDVTGGVLTLYNCTFTSNHARDAKPGALYRSDGLTNVTSCHFVNNRGVYSAGAIWVEYSGGMYGDVLLLDSTFTGNTAEWVGGAVQHSPCSPAEPWWQTCALVVQGCTFSMNSARYKGGAVCQSNPGQFDVRNSTFIGNSALEQDAPGGAVSAAGDVQLTGCMFAGNSADGGSGGAVAAEGKVQLTECVFERNSANDAGGVMAGTLEMQGCTFSNNTAWSRGGALMSHSNALSSAAVFASNAAQFGGALFLSGSYNVSDCRLFRNSADIQGGAVLAYFDAVGTLTNVEVAHNRATLGAGLFFLGQNDCTVHNSTFTRNIAARRGGAVYSSFRCTLKFVGGALSENAAAQEGGGMFVAEASTVELVSVSQLNNTARDGGAVFLDSTAYGSFARCNLTGNAGGGDGGAVYLRNARADMTGVVLQDNRAAVQGGGAHVGDQSSLQTAGVAFMNNAAGVAGGGVGVAGVLQMTDACLMEGNLAVTGGAIYATGNVSMAGGSLLSHNAATMGGGLHVAAQGRAEVHNCSFVGNSAEMGAGLSVAEDGFVQLAECWLANNAAVTAGGGMWVGGGALLASCNLNANEAGQQGGAAMCKACQNITMEGCTVMNNVAYQQGGGLALQPAGWAKVANTSVTSNSALEGAGAFLSTASCTPSEAIETCLSLLSSTIADNMAQYSQQWETAADVVALRGLRLDIDAPDASGGGFFLKLAGNLTFAKLQDVQVQRNHAVLGGGALIDSRECTMDACAILQDVEFDGNTASPHPGTGQQLFLMSPRGVRLRCRGQGEWQLLQLTSRKEPAAGLCNLVTIVQPNMTSSAPFALQVLNSTQQVVASGVAFTVDFELVDMYMQRMQIPIRSDVTFQATLQSHSMAELSGGSQFSLAENGLKVVSTSLLLRAPSGVYNLVLRSNDGIVEPAANVSIHVRSCNIGERNDSRSSLCSTCDGNNFILSPEATCQNCKNGGNCSQGLLVPRDRYWHSHPRSPQFHRCLVDEACLVKDRWESLWQIQNSTKSDDRVGTASLAAYMLQQCNTAAGYTGALCSICQEGFGPTGRRCRPCTHAIGLLVLTVAVQALAIAVQVVIFFLGQLTKKRHTRLVAETVRAVYETNVKTTTTSQAVTLPDTEAAKSSAQAVNEQGSAATADSVLLKSLSIKSRDGQAQSIGRQHSTVNPDSAIDSIGRQHSGLNPDSAADSAAGHAAMQLTVDAALKGSGRAVLAASTQACPGALQPTPSSGTVGNAAAPAPLLLAQGVLKLLLQYVQLLGTMKVVPFNMPIDGSSEQFHGADDMVTVFLQAADVTGAVSAQPLYCSLEGDAQRRKVAALLIQVLLPVAFVLAAALVCCMAWLARHVTGHRSNAPRKLLRWLVVCWIFTFLFFYPAVSQQLLLIFSFINLDTATTEPGAVTPMIGWFWAQHLALQYNHATHRTLLLAVGLPGLLLFALGLPLTILLLLFTVRNRLDEVRIRGTYGMLFEDYRLGAFYWQSVVLLLQLMFIACAILLNSLGPRVQLLMAVVMLALYSYAFALVQPFSLSQLYGPALLTHTCLLLSLVLIVFLHSTSSARVWLAVAVLLVVGNGCLLLGLLALTGVHVSREARQQNWLGKFCEAVVNIHDRALGFFSSVISIRRAVHRITEQRSVGSGDVVLTDLQTEVGDRVDAQRSFNMEMATAYAHSSQSSDKATNLAAGQTV